MLMLLCPAVNIKVHAAGDDLHYCAHCILVGTALHCCDIAAALFEKLHDAACQGIVIHVLFPEQEYPTDCDCIVMNDTRNFVSMMIDADDYDHAYCFFPHSFIGQVMEQTLQSRSSSHYTMKSYLYEGYLNLHEFAKSKPQIVE